jgi:hypothetical protein
VDPYQVLGVEAGASPAEVRTRYRVLVQLFHPDRLQGMPDGVREEAERRMKELNLAYGRLEKGFPTGRPDPPKEPAGRRRVLNPDDVPLSMLPFSQRPAATSAAWEEAGVEPILIRVEGRTGLTLATPATGDEQRPARFLSDHQGIHLARSAEGLIELAGRVGPWRRLGRAMPARRVEVLPENRFDLTEALEMYVMDVEFWDPALLSAAFRLSYELALHLELDEVIEAMMPGSALHLLHNLVRRLDGGTISQWSARQGIAKFDRADVFQAWCDVTDNLSGQLRWHG